jgi:hypothetical protein
MAPPRSSGPPPRIGGPPAHSRTRRGSVDRPINARLVRGTLLLVSLPLLLAAFTVARPQPLPPPALPPSFDAETAAGLARELARDFPDRAPGSAGALGAGQWFVDQLGLYGFDVEADRFSAEVPGRGRVTLQNLVAVAPGPSPRVIVFMAHRDNTGESPGANDNASGTAALIELARAFAPVTGPSGGRTRPAHTLVFVSTDGGAFGALGAARFAERSSYREDAVAVVSLDAIAGPGFPQLLIAGDTPRSPSPVLVRTAAVRILEEAGEEPRRESALDQLLTLGFPFTLGEQGPLLGHGIPAVTLTTERRPAPSAFVDEPLDLERLGEVGRAAQNLLGSLDAGLELTGSTSSYVYFGRRLVRGWAISLVLLAALLPFLIATVDLFARMRRRRVPLAPAVGALRSRLAFWAYAGALVLVGALLGVFPDAEARPLPPTLPEVVEPPGAALAVLGVLLLGGWLVSRERLLPQRAATPEETLAGYTTALLGLGLLTLVVVATNPFALVFVLPSLYAWLWLPQAPALLARLLLLSAGFLGPALLVVSFANRYALGLDAPWYLLSLVGVGYVPWFVAALTLAWLAISAQLAALAVGRYGAGPGVSGRGSRGSARRLIRHVTELVHPAREPDRRDEALEA